MAKSACPARARRSQVRGQREAVLKKGHQRCKTWVSIFIFILFMCGGAAARPPTLSRVGRSEAIRELFRITARTTQLARYRARVGRIEANEENICALSSAATMSKANHSAPTTLYPIGLPNPVG